MSSRHEVSRYRERSRSHSLERKRDHKSRDKDRSTKSKSPAKSKHRSTSREKKKKSKSSKHKKNKKKKKRSSSSSSSSSSDSGEEELKLLQRLEAERQRLKEEKRTQKEALKAKETPEEKRARRLREKQEKERKRRERMGWDTEYQCYTNQDNPFGDSALTNTFVWSKKLAKEGVKTVSHDELEALNRQKQLENKIELEKVKQRRLEREAERAAREAEAAATARAREAQQFSSWARQEDAFHLQQARLRSQIRIRDGRAKPIDLLAWYVSSEECVDALEMHEPYTYLNGLQSQDLEDLLEDIKVYKELEKEANQSYWADVETIVVDELGKLRRLAAPAAARAGVHQAVAADVAELIRGRTASQLAALQEQIEAKLRGERAGVDVGYWESLLSQLRAHRARARLRARHQHNLRRKLSMLKEEQGVQAPAPHDDSSVMTPKPETSQAEPPAEPEAEGSDSDDGSGEASIALYQAGRYSPPLLAAGGLEPATILTEPQEDDQRLEYLRARLHAANAQAAHTAAQVGEACRLFVPDQRARFRSGRVRLFAEPRARTVARSQSPLCRALRAINAILASQAAAGAAETAAAAAAAAPSSSRGTTAALERAAARAMGSGGDEAGFSVEHALPDQPCLWADKYRPRKPRYFNRVHTGFEWNKYNQTHYDMDNPPPKIVQGYKFNIFYPDLIDPRATPEFSLKPCPDNPEFAVLRFHAGPPYEDIAFKIVNREWEYSYKRGFRCHFHNNIFQLWFHFKRYRYRR